MASAPVPEKLTANSSAWLQRSALALLLILEIIVFARIGQNFFSLENGFQILRVSVEIGLLAVALTPIIITGGIDLSVGSLMGLSAVIFGKLWRDAGLPIPLAAAGTLAFGACAGSLNGLLITRLRIPPLIATLGTFSLFRGLAEGLTAGFDNFTDFPAWFTFIGQENILRDIPAQLPIFAVVIVAYWLMMHRMTLGRALVAIGFSPEGARYAGLDVKRQLLLVYALAGLISSLASLIYVAHLGQAKADAGTGYELRAIAAVVLGGTSIFGGRGTIHGTLLGLLAIAVLPTGLRLAELHEEYAGILTGVLLLVAIGLDRLGTLGAAAQPTYDEEMNVRNSQVAALAIVILLGALIVAGSNFYLMQQMGAASGQRVSLPPQPEDDKAPKTTQKAPHKQIVIGMMPKSLGNAYFIACKKGALEAEKELGVKLLWNGPTDPDPAAQNEMIETWITLGVDVIAVSVENRDAISTVLRKARNRGIKVITWDSDCQPDARDFFVNQATPEGIGQTLMDNAAKIMDGKGQFAIITASLTAANMIAWQKAIEARRADKYPDIKLAADPFPCDDVQSKAYEAAKTILNAYPEVKLIMAICSPAVPGAAEAVKQSGRKDVSVIGLGLPNENRAYVKEGVTKGVVLWNTMDLGYLTVYASKALAEGTLKAGDANLAAGKIGNVRLQGDNILLGTPFTFTKENIDQFDF